MSFDKLCRDFADTQALVLTLRLSGTSKRLENEERKLKKLAKLLKEEYFDGK